MSKMAMVMTTANNLMKTGISRKNAFKIAWKEVEDARRRK